MPNSLPAWLVPSQAVAGTLNWRAFVFDPKGRLAFVVLSNTAPDLRLSTRPDGGVGTAEVARQLLRPRIPLGGECRRSV